MSNHRIICGEVIPALKSLPDEYVDMLMTSVPYWNLRDYGEDTATIWGGDEGCEHEWNIKQINKSDAAIKQGPNSVIQQSHTEPKEWSSAFCSKCNAWRGQLGLEETPEDYIGHLRMVFAEVKRVLKKTGTCWVNIGDSYSNRGECDPSRWKGKEVAYRPACNLKSLPPKCMVMVPERFTFMMLDLGYTLRNKIIWKKDNAMPNSVKDRFNTTWEYLYFFTKNNKPVYFYNDKSGAMVEKNPTSQIEGVDWGWKTCPFCDGTGVVKKNEYTLAKWFEGELKMRFGEPCKRCKTTGKVKVNYWHSVDYWFDLDAVRKPYTEPLNRWGGNEVKIPEKTKWKSDDEKAKWCMSIGDRQSRPNPSGKNPGDVIEMSKEEWLEYCNYLWGLSHEHPDFFNINTQPFAQCHFAVFPGKLVEKPLLAGCPAEVCSVCGMARVRITKTIEDINNIPKEGWKKSYRGKTELTGSPQERSVSELYKESLSKQRETIGWSDCQCEGKDKYKPGICIDPFGGSGTVGIVAEKLARSSILIDIKKDYCEMAFKRLKPLVEQTKLTGNQSTIKKEGF